MATSGIPISTETVQVFNSMKLKSTHKYALFKIEDRKEVQVEVVGDKVFTDTTEQDKQEFGKLKALLTKEPRYILYDFGFTNKENRKITKLAFIFWCPDDCKVGDKMIYASTKDSVKKQFSGLELEFQANDKGDFDYDYWQVEVEKKA